MIIYKKIDMSIKYFINISKKTFIDVECGEKIGTNTFFWTVFL